MVNLKRIPLSKRWQRDDRKRRKTIARPLYGKGKPRTHDMLPEGALVNKKDIYFQMFKDEAPIRGAITVIVNAVCSTGWDIKTARKGDVDMEDPRVAEIFDWLSFPPRQFENVIRDICYNLLIYDNSFAELAMPNKAQNEVGWIYPLDTRDCNLQFSESGRHIVGVEYQVTSGEFPAKVIREKNLVHFALSKLGTNAGLSSLESLVRSADLYHASVDYNKELFDSNGVPAMAIVLEEGSEQDYELLESRLAETAQGDSLLIKGKARIEVLGKDVNELGYEKVIEYFYQEVMTCLQVPPVMMSKPGSGTMEASRDEVNSFTMMVQAIQRIISNGFSEGIIKIWGESHDDIRFMMKPWVNPTSEAMIDDTYTKAGVYTPNFILRRKGLPTVEWGDVPYNLNAPLGKGIGDIPDEQMEFKEREISATEQAASNQASFNESRQKGQDKPKGQQDEADGRKAELPRPDTQGKPKDNTKKPKVK